VQASRGVDMEQTARGACGGWGLSDEFDREVIVKISQ
jgi:hypothetical protein